MAQARDLRVAERASDHPVRDPALNARDHHGACALDEAAEKGYGAAAKLLVEKGAEVNAKNPDSGAFVKAPPKAALYWPCGILPVNRSSAPQGQGAPLGI